MDTLVELPDRAALIACVQKSLSYFELPPKVKIDQLTVTLYVDEPDTRIGWEKTYIVEVPGLGPVGFTDGPGMSGYWLRARVCWLPWWPPPLPKGRSSVIHEPPPDRWTRFVCWVLMGWRWHNMK